MKHIPLPAHDFPLRNAHGHCSVDPSNETCEKFFQIWSHKAANICNDLVEYTIRRLQSERLRLLFQTRNELTEREHIQPICQMSLHLEGDLERIKEHIRCFCLNTRNVYRHLRSDSRLFPQMSIDLDQSIMMKICRFIFKTKVLIQIFSKEQHLNEHQREQLKKYQIKQIQNESEINDPYRNITKAFVVLQSNFEILYGDILERDFLQNVKTAVRTLPIILDTSKTIRLIFCALYKLSEPVRKAEAEAIRQRRSAFCGGRYRSPKQPSVPNKHQENQKLKAMKELLKINQTQVTHTSATTPNQATPATMKTVSHTKSTNQPEIKTGSSTTKTESPNRKTHRSQSKISKISKDHLSPFPQKRHRHSSKKSSTSAKGKKKSEKSRSAKHRSQKTSKNRNAFTTDSAEYTEKQILIKNNLPNLSLNQSEDFSEEKLGWTTWLRNATLRLAIILPSNQTERHDNQSKPLLTTWASLDRISKL